MKKSSLAILKPQTSETIIVVENEEKEDDKNDSSSHHSSEEDNNNLNPYFLSPFAREVRKHSLPTPQCSGITASQVRRLSERGETAGPGARQAEFLATLSTAPQPTSGGRRHSVVTICRLPPVLFGRNRRESVAALPAAGRILPSRRESIACPPTTSESRGSVLNLQLDIMDDIVQARKVRMKSCSSGNEVECEVQLLDGASNAQKYSNSRRFSDFIGTALAPIPSRCKRRSSELPSTSNQISPTIRRPTNADIMAILSSLSTSAMEIHKCETSDLSTSKGNFKLQKDKPKLKGHRSNSFDSSVLEVDGKNDKSITRPSTWFAKRHQPLKTQDVKEKKNTQYQSLKEKLKETKRVLAAVPAKVLWDDKPGPSSESQGISSAIENFIWKSTSGKMNSSTNSSPKTSNKSKSWFSKGDDESSETCESSICSTLKDLFVK